MPQSGPFYGALVTQRVLFTAAGGHGHLQPLLPLAEHATRAGHDVLVTAAASHAAHVSSRGLAFAATGSDVKPMHAPLVVHDLEKEPHGVANHFVARLGRARATALLDLCRSWKPDVIVRDEVDFGAAVAGEAAGLPRVSVIVIGAGRFILPELGPGVGFRSSRWRRTGSSGGARSRAEPGVRRVELATAHPAGVRRPTRCQLDRQGRHRGLGPLDDQGGRNEGHLGSPRTGSGGRATKAPGAG